jgi:hypothetical protein
LSIGIATRSRRNGVDFSTADWPSLLFTGGRRRSERHRVENLTANRPAVFLFNQRNNFDVLVTAALVRENWTAVGKKELETDPIAVAKLGVISAEHLPLTSLLRTVPGATCLCEMTKRRR